MVFIISIFLAFASLLLKDLTFGPDFIGGGRVITKNIITLDKEINYVKSFNGNEALFTSKDIKSFNKDVEDFKKRLRNNGNKIEKQEFTGEKFAKNTLTDSIYTILFAFIAIWIYILIKFSFSFANIAAVGLLYNCICTFAIINLFSAEISVITISAFLTIIGYCVNDTVVVFDKIKEKAQNQIVSDDDLIRAIKSVFKRSIRTSIVTILGITPLLFLSNKEISNFALIVIIGIVIGTFTSLSCTFVSKIFFNLKVKKAQDKMKEENPMKYI